MKILFLDIDGVLKPARSYWLPHRHQGSFDPLGVAAVNKICEKTGALIVTNTVWNREDNLTNILREQGITGAFHEHRRTEYPIEANNRWNAIFTWIRGHSKIGQWVALDDAESDHPRIIQVNGQEGISTEDYRNATRILGNEDKFIVMV